MHSFSWWEWCIYSEVIFFCFLAIFFFVLPQDFLARSFFFSQAVLLASNFLSCPYLFTWIASRIFFLSQDLLARSWQENNSELPNITPLFLASSAACQQFPFLPFSVMNFIFRSSQWEYRRCRNIKDLMETEPWNLWTSRIQKT